MECDHFYSYMTCPKEPQLDLEKGQHCPHFEEGKTCCYCGEEK